MVQLMGSLSHRDALKDPCLRRLLSHGTGLRCVSLNKGVRADFQLEVEVPRMQYASLRGRKDTLTVHITHWHADWVRKTPTAMCQAAAEMTPAMAFPASSLLSRIQLLSVDKWLGVLTVGMYPGPSVSQLMQQEWCDCSAKQLGEHALNIAATVVSALQYLEKQKPYLHRAVGPDCLFRDPATGGFKLGGFRQLVTEQVSCFKLGEEYCIDPQLHKVDPDTGMRALDHFYTQVNAMDFTSDLYGLGVLLLSVVTRVPAPEVAAQLLEAALSGSMCPLLSGLSASPMKDYLLQLLQPEPQDRFRSLQDASRHPWLKARCKRIQKQAAKQAAAEQHKEQQLQNIMLQYRKVAAIAAGKTTTSTTTSTTSRTSSSSSSTADSCAIPSTRPAGTPRATSIGSSSDVSSPAVDAAAASPMACSSVAAAVEPSTAAVPGCFGALSIAMKRCSGCGSAAPRNSSGSGMCSGGLSKLQAKLRTCWSKVKQVFQ